MTKISLPGNGVLKVELSDYNGAPEIDVRRWFRGADGAEHATRQGVRVPPDAAEAFLRAVTDAVGALRTSAKAKPARTSKAKRTAKRKAAKPAEEADALAKIHERLAAKLGVRAEDLADLIG